MVKVAVSYVRARAGDAAVDLLLDAVGDTRSDGGGAYDQRTAVLRSAAAVTDDQLTPLHIGQAAVKDGVEPALMLTSGTFADPQQFFLAIGREGAELVTGVVFAASDVTHRSAMVTTRLTDEHEPDSVGCLYHQGLLTDLPVVYGVAPATVVHTSCRADGGDRCLFSVEWEPAHSARSGRGEAFALSEHLEAFQAVVTELVSSQDVPTVLSRIAKRASSAVRAAGFLLVVTPIEGGPLSVHCEGMPFSEARTLAFDLLDGRFREDGSRIVVDVGSSRCQYGRLVAFHPDGRPFSSDDRTLLSSYAALAAVALDSADTLETTKLLLGMAESLRNELTLSGVCVRIAESAPAIVGAPRSAVFLWDEDEERLHAAGAFGCFVDNEDGTPVSVDPCLSDELSEAIRSRTFAFLDPASTNPVVRVVSDRLHGQVLVAVPVFTGDNFEAMMFLSWIKGGPHSPPGTGLRERLEGMASQAGSGIEKARLLERVRHQSMHDHLTGLPNRMLFSDRVEQALKRSQRTSEAGAVFFIDLNRFKDVNDTYGHPVGDELLRNVAARLQRVARASDTVARISGDEFTMLAVPLGYPEDVEVLADRIRCSFDDPFVIGGVPLRISASVGHSSFPDASTDLEELLRVADDRMYDEKRNSRARRTS